MTSGSPLPGADPYGLSPGYRDGTHQLKTVKKWSKLYKGLMDHHRSTTSVSDVSDVKKEAQAQRAIFAAEGSNTGDHAFLTWGRKQL